MTARTFVYVSNAQDGTIDGYAMEPATGALTSIGTTEAGNLVMPMAVGPDRRFLYAAVRSEPFRIVTFAIDRSTGALARMATAPLPDSMAYLATDRSGRYLLSASYGGNIAAVSAIGPDGHAAGAVLQTCPTGRNAHAILADRSNRFVFVPTLGSDLVMQYRFDAASGQLTPNDPPSIGVAAGHGPRHLAFSKDNRFVYVLNELSGHVAQFALDQADGTLTAIDSVASVPADEGLVPGIAQASLAASLVQTGEPVRRIWAADIQITPDGRFLYATERTTSTIVEFAVASGTGRLVRVASFETEAQPRGIRIDRQGRFLIASGEKSDRLSVFAIDAGNGALGRVGRYPVGRGANWVEIVEVE